MSTIFDLSECYNGSEFGGPCADLVDPIKKLYKVKDGVSIRTYKYTASPTLFSRRAVKTTLLLTPGTTIRPLREGLVTSDKVYVEDHMYCKPRFWEKYVSNKPSTTFPPTEIDGTYYPLLQTASADGFYSENNRAGIYSCSKEELTRWSYLENMF